VTAGRPGPGRVSRALGEPWLAAGAALLVLLALLPAGWLPDDHTTPRLLLRHRPPAWLEGGALAFPLGTDALGRSILTRILVGTRLTLGLALAAAALATLAGAAAGLWAGYAGGRADSVVMRLCDILLAFPIVLLVLALVAALGASVTNLVLVLALTGWAELTRVVRAAVLSLREMEFVEAARAVGAGPGRVIGQHLLVNVASPLLVLATFLVSRFILTESAISFLGLGVAPPATTWGAMIGEGRKYLFEAWWATAFPGGAIVLAVLIANLLGDSLRDAFDPYRTLRTEGAPR
jgi:peptide/nickel transport system permease protein